MSAQPSLNQAYTTPGNPVSKEPLENAQTEQNANTNTEKIAKRTPTSTSPNPTPSSLANGIHGAPPGEESTTTNAASKFDRSNENDGEQMAAPAESKIADAVEQKPGATGAQEGLESDLDRKKAEQAPLRDQVKEQREKDVDVGGVLGQRGGPASTV